MSTPDSTEAHPLQRSTGEWHVVPASSQLGFFTRIMFGLMPIRGRYGEYEGELHIDDAGNASGVLQVAAETISTGIKQRDKHLRSTDFFAVERHPHLRFELASLVPDAAGAATLAGTLHIRDRELAINTPVSVTSVGADGLRIDADFEVDHRAAGFEFKMLPRTVRIQAALTLARTT